MRTLRQVNIKNRQNYFFNSMTNIKNFDPSLLSIDQVSFKKVLIVLFMVLNISEILIIKILSILFLIMSMHTLQNIMKTSHRQLQYALGSFGLITQAHASMYVSTLIQFIISCSTAADDDLN